jgi:hypothetical protein
MNGVSSAILPRIVCTNSSIFQENIQSPSAKSTSMRSDNKQAAYTLLTACLGQSSALKMGTAFSSETPINIYRALRRHILGDGTLHSHRHEKNKCHRIKGARNILSKNV